jgi:hypothetical protein
MRALITRIDLHIISPLTPRVVECLILKHSIASLLLPPPRNAMSPPSKLAATLRSETSILHPQLISAYMAYFPRLPAFMLCSVAYVLRRKSIHTFIRRIPISFVCLRFGGLLDILGLES